MLAANYLLFADIYYLRSFTYLSWMYSGLRVRRKPPVRSMEGAPPAAAVTVVCV